MQGCQLPIASAQSSLAARTDCLVKDGASWAILLSYTCLEPGPFSVLGMLNLRNRGQLFTPWYKSLQQE